MAKVQSRFHFPRERTNRISRSILNFPRSSAALRPHLIGNFRRSLSRQIKCSRYRLSNRNCSLNNLREINCRSRLRRPLHSLRRKRPSWIGCLMAWEQKSKEVKTFDCSFMRWEYDPVFAKPDADPNAPAFNDQGIIEVRGS